MALVELPGFEEAVRRHKWTGERLPVPFHGQRFCSRCGWGSVVIQLPVTQPALFYHGGYGESERVTAAVCTACHHSTVIRKESVSPRGGRSR